MCPPRYNLDAVLMGFSLSILEVKAGFIVNAALKLPIDGLLNALASFSKVSLAGANFAQGVADFGVQFVDRVLGEIDGVVATVSRFETGLLSTVVNATNQVVNQVILPARQVAVVMKNITASFTLIDTVQRTMDAITTLQQSLNSMSGTVFLIGGLSAAGGVAGSVATVLTKVSEAVTTTESVAAQYAGVQSTSQGIVGPLEAVNGALELVHTSVDVARALKGLMDTAASVTLLVNSTSYATTLVPARQAVDASVNSASAALSQGLQGPAVASVAASLQGLSALVDDAVQYLQQAKSDPPTYLSAPEWANLSSVVLSTVVTVNNTLSPTPLSAISNLSAALYNSPSPSTLSYLCSGQGAVDTFVGQADSTSALLAGLGLVGVGAPQAALPMLTALAQGGDRVRDLVARMDTVAAAASAAMRPGTGGPALESISLSVTAFTRDFGDAVVAEIVKVVNTLVSTMEGYLNSFRPLVAEALIKLLGGLDPYVTAAAEFAQRVATAVLEPLWDFLEQVEVVVAKYLSPDSVYMTVAGYVADALGVLNTMIESDALETILDVIRTIFKYLRQVPDYVGTMVNAVSSASSLVQDLSPSADGSSDGIILSQFHKLVNSTVTSFVGEAFDLLISQLDRFVGQGTAVLRDLQHTLVLPPVYVNKYLSRLSSAGSSPFRQMNATMAGLMADASSVMSSSVALFGNLTLALPAFRSLTTACSSLIQPPSFVSSATALAASARLSAVGVQSVKASGGAVAVGAQLLPGVLSQLTTAVARVSSSGDVGVAVGVGGAPCIDCALLLLQSLKSGLTPVIASVMAAQQLLPLASAASTNLGSVRNSLTSVEAASSVIVGASASLRTALGTVAVPVPPILSSLSTMATQRALESASQGSADLRSSLGRLADGRGGIDRFGSAATTIRGVLNSTSSFVNQLLDVARPAVDGIASIVNTLQPVVSTVQGIRSAAGAVLDDAIAVIDTVLDSGLESVLAQFNSTVHRVFKPVQIVNDTVR